MKIKPCPFCGSTRWHYGYDYGSFIACEKCGASGPWKPLQDDGQAIRSWTLRAKEKKWAG